MLMYEAAVVLMTRVKRASGLKDWAQAIARRSGAGKARIALARKLAVIMHHLAFGRAIPLARAVRVRLIRLRDPLEFRSRRNRCPTGAKVQAAARAAVGPHEIGASPLWTLRRLRFGPDVAAEFVPTAERTMTPPRQQTKQSD
jgi:hypothetical protein